jgi:hypothetical protein
MVVMETTNPMMNNSLYDLVTHNSVLSWIRVTIANRLAVDGSSWSAILSTENSG